MVKEYENLYPLRLFVTDKADIKILQKRFLFARTFADLYNGLFATPDLTAPVYGCALLVEEKSTKLYGVLVIMLTNKTEHIAHECIHYADAVFQHCGVTTTNYEDGNEAYTYLVTWAVKCVTEFLKNARKTRKKERS